MNEMVIICTGGELGSWALSHIRSGDQLIGADSGALFLIEQGFTPDTSIGDFDSVTAEQLERIQQLSGETITCDPIDKNYTDTEMAFRHALALRPAEIILLGALGTRFDHSLANVHLLMLALEQGIAASIIDEHNHISLTSGILPLHKGDYTNVSLLPLSATVTGINLQGFQYPLYEAELRIGQSLGISNVLVEPTGTVSIRSGILLVIQSRD